MKNENQIESPVSNLIRLAILFIFSGFMLIPFWVTFIGGFKSLGELRVNPFTLPTEWDFSIYGTILTSADTWKMMLNSLIVTGVTIFLVLLVASMVAFTFSHIKFAGKKYIYNYLIAGMMFPAATAILPLFIKVRDLGLLDTYPGVILPQVAFGLAMSMMFFRTFFEQLPKDLFEAALVDGCSYIRFFFTIVMPLSTPILATVGVFILVGSWNNYIMPLIFVNDKDLYTWPLGLMAYRGEYGVEWNKILAYVTVTIVPAIIFFLFAQKYIVAGLGQGAVKG